MNSTIKDRIERLERDAAPPKTVYIKPDCPTEAQRRELDRLGLACLILPDNGRDPHLDKA